MDLTVVELFAGVGGFRVGLNRISRFRENTGVAVENGGWDFVWANQYEPATKVQHAFNCYTTRFGSDSCSNQDIHEVDKTTIPQHSLLVGGFPCQDYSVARSLSNEQGIEGKKGVLFWDIRDVLLEKQSPFVLLENVDRLLKSPSTMRGRDFAIMLKTLDSLGYYVTWRVINAGEYGMPQKRRRVFIFAFRKDTQYASYFSERSPREILRANLFTKTFPVQNLEYDFSAVDLNAYKDILEVSNTFKGGGFKSHGFMVDGKVHHLDVKPEVEKLYSLKKLLKKATKYSTQDKRKCVISEDKLPKWQYLKGAKRVERTARNGHKYFYSEGGMSFPENLEQPARTLLTSEGTLNRSSHIVFDEEMGSHRILTPVECEMIQMFPPMWTEGMPNRSRYFMMGNALVTGIIARLEPSLRKIIEAEQ